MLTAKIKSKKEGLVRAAISLAAAFLLTAAVTFVFKDERKAYTVSSGDPSAPQVIVDAGHGGFDGGAVASDGTKESDLNISVALKTASFLKILGIKPMLTRSGDEALNLSEGTIREMKVSDMNNRLEIMKSYPDAVFLSIHMNKYESSLPHGAQVFYSPQANSAEFAEILQSSLKENVDKNNKRTIKAADKNIYLLYRSPMIAVIAECGFLSNESELERLKSRSGQTDIAFALAAGTAEYLKKVEKSD